MASRSVNQITLLGNIGKDPEVRQLRDGKSMVSFSVATSTSYKDSAGEWKDRTQWHNVVSFSDYFVKMMENARKGMQVFVQGEMTYRQWEDQSGNKRTNAEVSVGGYEGKIVLTGASNGGDRQERGGNSGGQRQQPQQRQRDPRGAPSWDAPKGDDDLSDEIPF